MESEYRVQLIPLHAIDPGPHQRVVDLAYAQRIADGLGESEELMHPITVVQKGDRYECNIGGHRMAAYELKDRTHIPARVLPEGTDELALSLKENHSRRPETLDECVDRIAALAKQHGCSDAEAARLGSVEPSYFSRAKKVINVIKEEPKQFADEAKIGLSVLYLVASRTKSARQQLQAFKWHVAGKSRDEIDRLLGANTSSNSKPKKLRLQLSHGNAQLRLCIAEDATYGELAEVLAEVKSQLMGHRKNNIAVKSLPRVLKDQAAETQKS